MILGADGNPIQSTQDGPRDWSLEAMAPSAGYDVLAKRCETDNWDLATSANANSAETREARQNLRNLSRYEARNNPHLAGLVRKIANEVIGSGPRLSVEPRTPTDRSVNASNRLEALWEEYAAQIHFTQKLHLAIHEKIIGGEVFVIKAPNDQAVVPVDFHLYEADQFCTPENWEAQQYNLNDGPVDGIRFDSQGNPEAYWMRTQHPHGNHYGDYDYQLMPAELVWHWFRKDRPSQYRGIPETTPALQVYSILRRFVESKISQEELRAKMTGVIKTAFSPDAGCARLPKKRHDMMIGDGQFTTLPEGWDAQLFRMDVTGMGVQEFMRAILGWATNVFLAPWNVSAGDSSDYNFASGRLDYMIFYHVIEIIRQEMQREFLDDFYWWWSSFAELTRRMPTDLGLYKIRWYWDRKEAIDPLKEAQATATLKEAGLLNETDYVRDQGYEPLEYAESQIRYELTKEKMRQDIAAELGVDLNDQNITETESETETEDDVPAGSES